MIEVSLLRHLYVRTAEGAVIHMSAASALLRVGDYLYAVADDQTYLARFSLEGDTPAEIVTLFDEQWPERHKARKKAKADLEALAYLPPSKEFTHGALLALGSGSRPNRMRGALLIGAAGDEWSAPRTVDLSALFAPLQALFPQLNIEGAFATADEFVLLHRGNKGDARNACIRFALDEIQHALMGRRSFAGIAFDIHFYALGEVDGVPLCFTDAAALPGGRFAFSAVAEDVADNYNDGQCTGAAVGIADLSGKLLQIEVLDCAYKIEGIEVRDCEGGIELLLVTDADAPEIPACLLQARLPTKA